MSSVSYFYSCIKDFVKAFKACRKDKDKDSDIAKKMANVIAVKSGREDNEKTRVLLKALKQDNIATFIKAKFGDSVIYIV